MRLGVTRTAQPYSQLVGETLSPPAPTLKGMTMTQVAQLMSLLQSVAKSLGRLDEQRDLIFNDGVIYIAVGQDSDLVQVSVSRADRSWLAVLDRDEFGGLNEWSATPMALPKDGDPINWVDYVEQVLVPQMQQPPVVSQTAHFADILLLERISDWLVKFVEHVIVSELNRNAAFEAMFDCLEQWRDIGRAQADPDQVELITLTNTVLAIAAEAVRVEVKLKVEV